MNINKLPIKKVFEKGIRIPSVNLESFVDNHKTEFAVYDPGSAFLGTSTRYSISDFTDDECKSSAEFVEGHLKTIGVLQLTDDVRGEDALYFIKKTGHNFSSEGVCMPHVKGLAIAWLTAQEEMLKHCEVGRPIYGLDEEQYLQEDNVSQLGDWSKYILPYLKIDNRDPTKFEFKEQFGRTLTDYLHTGDMLLYLRR